MERPRQGFTLVDLLLIILTLAILAALITMRTSPGKQAEIIKARIEMSALVQAIEAYDQAYGHFPVSAAVLQAAGSGDVTCGSIIPAPIAATKIGTLVNNSVVSNSEVIAILMNLTNFPGNQGEFTANTNYLLNPQRIIFLSPHLAADTVSPGVGLDLVYRDPWGTPYFVTLDLNRDGQCNDVFYGQQGVSQQNGTGSNGYHGLVNNVDAGGNGNHFQYHGKVMVWSAGPDKKIKQGTGTRTPANQAENKDNVLSWE